MQTRQLKTVITLEKYQYALGPGTNFLATLHVNEHDPSHSCSNNSTIGSRPSYPLTCFTDMNWWQEYYMHCWHDEWTHFWPCPPGSTMPASHVAQIHHCYRNPLACPKCLLSDPACIDTKFPELAPNEASQLSGVYKLFSATVCMCVHVVCVTMHDVCMCIDPHQWSITRDITSLHSSLATPTARRPQRRECSLSHLTFFSTSKKH